MKKNLFFGLFATMMLLLTTACQKENDLLGNGEATISFEISTPQMATRAFSDGTTATQLQYAVYDEQGNPIQRLSSDANEFRPVIINDFNGKRTINIQLAAGKKYNVLFWASAPNSPYSVNYTTKELSVDYTKTVCNSDANDAFYCYKSVTVDATKSEPVTLKRPFAQLNIGTNDLSVKNEVDVTKTGVKVKGIYNTFNLAENVLGGDINTEYTFALAARPEGETFKVDGYEYLAMAYVLVGNDKNYVTDVKLCYGASAETAKTREFTNIPVRGNYRTNLYGALLTNNIGFDVEIEEDFDGDAVITEAEKLIVAAQTGGTYTLADDIILTEALNVTAEFTLNLNGHNIYIDATYDNSNYEASSAIVNGDKGVLTLTGNGEIKALNNYTVRNNGKMVIDGVTIKNGVMNFGDLTIESGSISNDRSDKHAIYGNSAKLTVNGGTFHNENAGNATIFAYAGEVIINDGVFTIADGTATLGWTSCLLDAQGSAKFTINGGKVNGSIRDYNNNTTIYGGIYSVKPNANFIADGYKAVESNGKWVVVAEDVDAVVSTQEALNNVTFAEGATIVLTAGEYVLPDNAQGKKFTIQGTNNPADVRLTAQNDGASEGNCDYSLRGSKVTFNNITVTTTGTYFPGYAYMEGTFNNCIINGVYAVYQSSSFNDCTFNVSGDLYNLWTWGGEEVNLNNCTFNCDGKAVLLYGTANTKLTANNCTFNDNGDDTVTGKAAIEIGNDYNKSYELVVNNATVNGFAINPEGYNTGSKLWANKNSMGTDKLKVTIDGENGYRVIATEAIENMAGTTYSGDFFENTINDALYFNNWVLNENATIKVNRTYGAIILENVSGKLNGNVIEINNDNNSVMVLQDCNFTLQDGMKLIKSVKTIHQVFMSNITINGVKLTQDDAAEYLENVGWYQVVEEI